MDSSIHPVRAFRLGQKPPMSLADLANRLGTTKTNLWRIESGKQRISAKLLPRLVAETGLSADRLRPDLSRLFRLSARSRSASARAKQQRRSRAA
jgi:transcriptional regulator with XRE-family HTH domain